jgi:RNA polymerase sigma-70 factor (ECF subfamily)
MTDKEFADIIHSTKGVVLSAIEKNLSERFYHAIDDIVQETYIRAYNSLVKKKFRGESKLETWLFTIARNEAIRMGKRLEREEKKFQKSLEETDIFNRDDPEKIDEDIEELYQKIQMLPETYRAAMELVSGGFTEKEIAAKLNIKKGTVKSRISRGKEMLLKLYGH